MIPVTKAVREAIQPLTADLVVFRGTVYREREEVVYGPDLTPKTKVPRKHARKILEPVDVELHVNALSVGILGTVAVAAGVAGWVLWEGLSASTPFGGVQLFKGLKTTNFWVQEANKAKACAGLRAEIRRQRSLLKLSTSPAEREAIRNSLILLDRQKAIRGCRF